ncbi:uncharacterized protein CBL_10274 [Carabus blaptoides fortunei]
MAGPRKKRTVEQKPDSNSSESEAENMEVEGTLEADFEGRNPDASDFHGIQQLLKQLFLKAHINLTQLSDMIIAQQGIGSVLKQSMDDDDDEDEDDDSNSNDVFGITTIINLTANNENECVKQLFEALKTLAQKHASKEIEEQLNSILTNDNKKLGLLLNERFINIPAKIADPLMDSLQNEIERIAKKNPSYNFDYFLMICKTYKQLNKEKKDEGILFINAEEEIFAKASDVSFEFSVANETDTGVGGLWTEDDKQMIPQRRVLVINAQKLPNIVQNVKTFVA